MCSKERLLDIVHNFIVFDEGIKKTCRHKSSSSGSRRRKRGSWPATGIIWHTQGSGKSLTMVWLAKWIRENAADARVLMITDRTELDEQIEGVFTGVEEKSIAPSRGPIWISHSTRHRHG